MATIKNPVYIVDWNGRQVFQFEAESLMRDITGRLLNHDGLFDAVQAPRNAFTNEPLTLAQQISVWLQLGTYKQSWAFAGLRTCRWNITKFQDEYSIPLRLHSLRRTLHDINHIDTKDTFLDFIQIVHTYAGMAYSEDRYIQNMKNPESLVISKLRSLCLEYHETAILYPTNLAKIILEEQRILKTASRWIYR
jgi:hypothetical protein